MSGGIYNVTARDNDMGCDEGCVTGLLVKTELPRGGEINGATFERIYMRNVSRVYSWIPAV